MNSPERLWTSLSQAAYFADMQDIPTGATPVQVLLKDDFFQALRLYMDTVEEAVEKERKRLRERLGL